MGSSHFSYLGCLLTRPRTVCYLLIFFLMEMRIANLHAVPFMPILLTFLPCCRLSYVSLLHRFAFPPFLHPLLLPFLHPLLLPFLYPLLLPFLYPLLLPFLHPLLLSFLHPILLPFLYPFLLVLPFHRYYPCLISSLPPFLFYPLCF